MTREMGQMAEISENGLQSVLQLIIRMGHGGSDDGFGRDGKKERKEAMDQKKKMNSTGIEDFRDFRTYGCYYVDKTGLIRALLRNWQKVTLITRPRRFVGKASLYHTRVLVF